MRPDVSFIIAAYNAASTIERSLASALASQSVTIEVVVADDASQDDTAAVVEGLGDPRVRLVRLRPNGGPSAARNAALAAAHGRYVAILDADDEVRPDRMARLVGRLDAVGADAVVDNLEHVGGLSGTTPTTMFPPELFDQAGTLTLESYVRANRLFSGGYNFGYLKPVFRLDTLRRLGLAYPETIRIGEDFLFLAALLAAGGRCVMVGEVGYTYHVTKGSVSRVLALAHVERMVDADREFLDGRSLSATERQAWDARGRSLDEAMAFLAAVDAIKGRAPLAFLRHALRAPLAMRHFHMPIAARLRRRLGARRGLQPGSGSSARSASRAASLKAPE